MDGVRKKHISFLTTIVHHFKYNALLSISATLWSQFHFPPFIALSYFYGGNIPLLNTDFLILRVLPFGAIKYDTSKLWRATPFHCSACMCACFLVPALCLVLAWMDTRWWVDLWCINAPSCSWSDAFPRPKYRASLWPTGSSLLYLTRLIK